jgi:hypothetical protein
MDETAICTQIATVLNGVGGLRAFGNFQAQVNPPAAVVLPGANTGFKYDSLDGAVTFNIRIDIFVSYVEDASSVAQLQSYLATTGTSSVYAALLANQRSAVYDSILPAGFTRYGLRELAGQQYFAATVPCTILAS